MIKVCYVIGQLSKGGAEKQLYELIRGLNKKKFLPAVISLSQGGFWSKEIKKIGIEVIELKRKKNMEISRLFNLIKIVRKMKPDIVHTYLFSANSYGRIAAIINRVPVIIASERNMPEIGKDKNIYQLYIDKVMGFFSDIIICNSQAAANILIDKYNFKKEKILVVHNGINTDISCTSVVRNSEIIIGTVCRLSPQKNLKLFLDMAKLLSDLKSDLKFMIVGDGLLRDDLEKYSEFLGVRHKIIFMGEQHNVFDLLQKISIFVNTSSYEGLSNAIMEAMLTGLPVVATDVGGNSELITNGETGFLCKPDNLEEIVEKVMYLINNKEVAEKMGEKGREKIIYEFDSNKMIRKIEDIYLRLFYSNRSQKNLENSLHYS